MSEDRSKFGLLTNEELEKRRAEFEATDFKGPEPTELQRRAIDRYHGRILREREKLVAEGKAKVMDWEQAKVDIWKRIAASKIQKPKERAKSHE